MKKTKMMAYAVHLFSSCFLVFLACMNGLADAAMVFKVGDELGWQEPGGNNTAVYTQWAERNRFQVGDSLCEFVTICFTWKFISFPNFNF